MAQQHSLLSSQQMFINSRFTTRARSCMSRHIFRTTRSAEKPTRLASPSAHNDPFDQLVLRSRRVSIVLSPPPRTEPSSPLITPVRARVSRVCVCVGLSKCVRVCVCVRATIRPSLSGRRRVSTQQFAPQPPQIEYTPTQTYVCILPRAVSVSPYT